MSKVTEQLESSSVPEDYPGRITRFDAESSEIVLAMFGHQSQDLSVAHADRAALDELLEHDDGPTHKEYASYIDAQGMSNELLLVYWTSLEQQRKWWSSAAVKSWWSAFPGAGLGRWREIMATTQGRHQYASGQESPAGPSAFMELQGCDKFGFKGSYRARLGDSAHDTFEAALEHLPQPVEVEGHGRRLTVDLPENLCFIREGQTWDEASPEELDIWNSSMEKVVDDWVATLRDHPVETGCISIRDCVEATAEGVPIDRRSQFAFLLSLGHIEHAARTNPCHLRLMGAFNRMYAKLSFPPKMNIWVEVHIVKEGGIDVEYVNCHGGTGFLPYFPVREVAPHPASV